MNKKLTPIIAALTLLGATTLSYGATTNQDKTIQILLQRTQMLEHQLRDVQGELNAIHHQKPMRKYKRNNQRRYTAPAATTPVAAATPHGASSVSPTLTGMNEETPSWIYRNGTPVVTSPYLGTSSQFDASDLIVNFPGNTEDLRLLQEREKMQNRLAELNLPEPQHPLLLVSGKIEPIGWWNKTSNRASVSDIDVNTGELNITALMNSWVLGFFAVDYDGSYPLASLSSSRRLGNSRFFLNKGFVTIGKLNQFPIYATFGQSYVPFGRFSSNMIQSPLTFNIARTNGRMAELGYHDVGSTGPYAEAFVFKGDSRANNKINQFGLDGGYSYSGDTINADLGLSYIANIADADGMQATGGSFPGFSVPTTQVPASIVTTTVSRESLVHAVPAVDVHSALSIGHVGLLGEYVTATRSFDASNLMFNGVGATPKALNLEASYNFHLADKPSSIAIGYGQTWQALALAQPKQRYIAAWNTSFWKDTVATLEIRHEVAYAAADTASGTLTAAAGGPGNSSNVITGQFGIYF